MRMTDLGDCPECGTPLVRKARSGPLPTYCSGSCRAVACNRRAQADGRFDQWAAAAHTSRLARLPEKHCAICDALIPKQSGRRTLCGAEACQRANNARRVTPHVQARRARMSGVDAEKFFAHEIYERDGWTCGICAEPVDSRLSFPDPGSASLDHIKPLSRGGTHTRSNAQCSHFGCNRKKGTLEVA